MTTAIVTNLDPKILNRFTENPRAFAGKVSPQMLNDPAAQDPGIPAEDLNLGFTQKGGWQVPNSAPSKQDLWNWEFPENTPQTAIATPLLGGESISVRLAPRAEITQADLDFLQTGKMIVDPIVAALALYKLQIPTESGRYGRQHFDEEGSRLVMEHILSGGSAHASLLGVEQISALQNFFGIAPAMDTASRTPEKMKPKLPSGMIDFYGSSFREATQWIGTGSENIDPAIRSRTDFLDTLKSGVLPIDRYVEARREQIEQVLGHRQTPILFPDALHAALTDEQNVAIVRQLLDIKRGEIVLHKLGTPFNPLTDWLTLDVLRQTADLAYAVKSSDPRFPRQLDDFRAIRSASERADRPIVMYTGDDRGWAFNWELGARIQAAHVKAGNVAETYERNGFTFVRDQNISALLGYIGLNPRQTIVAIVRLSRWYEEISKPNADQSVANELLGQYWDIMGPALALGQDCFFGPNDPTKAYTHKVEMSHRLTGVLGNEIESRVLPHRDSHWAGDRENLGVVNSRLLVLLRAAGAVQSDELPGIIDQNKVRLNLA